LACLLLPGCANRATSPADEGETGQDTGSSTTGGDRFPWYLSVNRDVDVLFVIDNSSSMGSEQARLAQHIGAFMEVLESADVRVNFRVGVTTSDNGNPWCGTTTPEAGSLVYSSCLDRLPDFISSTGELDVQDVACQSLCTHDDAALGISADSQPWLEYVEGTSNIPQGISMTEAFRCLGPQGINGCGFEGQLESMNKALIRSDTSADPAFGFLRENAILAIIHVTDEADCSYNNSWASIFEESGNKVFWSDPAASFPTSAVCWNAGTACTDNGRGGYDCVAANYDVSGNLIPEGDPSTEDNAVLHPLSRFIDRVQGIENEKKERNAGQEVIVGLIAGVAESGEPAYADSLDPVYMQDFGIGPGCSSTVPGATSCMADVDCTGVGVEVCSPSAGYCLEEQSAAPPVRLWEFAETFTSDNRHSVCADDFAPALQGVAEAIVGQIRPSCYACVQDTDPSTEIVDANCDINLYDGPDSVQVPDCLRDSSGIYVVDPANGSYTMPDDAANICVARLVDPAGLYPGELDDMSAECVEAGVNLEFYIAARPGFPVPEDVSINLYCELSDDWATDCPDW
jgi:hypothetical protein